MIEAKVFRYPEGCTKPEGELIMSRVFDDDCETLDSILNRIEAYILNEQLNSLGECVVKVRFGNIARARQ